MQKWLHFEPGFFFFSQRCEESEVGFLCILSWEMTKEFTSVKWGYKPKGGIVGT